MTETNTRQTIPYTSAEQRCQKNINAQEAIGSKGTNSSSDNEKTSEGNVQGSDYEEPKPPTGLKRKASATSLTEVKRKRQTEDQVLEENGLDAVDPKEKIKDLMIHLDALKAECTLKDSQIEKLKAELDEKADEIKKLLATNSRYKSGLACVICTDYLANPCTINCGHSFCYSCLREWLNTNRENGSQCPSCRTEITAQPVLSFVLKNQVEAFVEQLSPEEKKRVMETLEKEDQKYKQISDHWAGIFDPSIRPLLDLEDGVLRCPTCGWEVEDSVCGNCNQQHIDIGNRDNNGDNNESNGDDDSEIGNESDAYDSNDSFIDDNPANDNDADNDTDNDRYVDGERMSANESYVTDEDENESRIFPHAHTNRLFNTIVINDSSSELSESIEEKNVIVISSGEDNEDKILHSSDEEPFRIHLNTHRYLDYLDQGDESQEEYKVGSEIEYPECNSDIHNSDEDDGHFY